MIKRITKPASVAITPRKAAQTSQRQISYLATGDLRPDPENPRQHSRAQVQAIATSIRAFGFNAPILVDRNRRVVAGHGRLQAALPLGLPQVPVLILEHLTDIQAKSYLLADNKLTDRSTWDDLKVATQLKELSELVLDFEIEAIGFEPPEIELSWKSK